MPSPSMSPDGGWSPAVPHTLLTPPALKPLPDVSENQAPVDGRHTTTSVPPSPSKSARRAARAVERTVSRAGLLAAEFAVFVKTARYHLPLSDTCATKLSVVDVAP